MAEAKATTCKHPDNCPEPVRANGWCARHYQRVRLTGDPGPVGTKRLPNRSTCTVEDETGRCAEPNVAGGFCERHRWHIRQHGVPGPVKRQQQRRSHDEQRRKGYVPVSERLIAKPGTGHIDSKGYRRVITEDGRRIFEHRLVKERELGRQLRDWERVHHKNGRRADNDPSNLELWVVGQPPGQRPGDLAEFLITYYPEELTVRGWSS